MNALFILAFSGFIAKMPGYVEFAQPDGSLRTPGRTRYAPVGAVNTPLPHVVSCAVRRWLLAWGTWRKRWFVKVQGTPGLLRSGFAT